MLYDFLKSAIIAAGILIAVSAFNAAISSITKKKTAENDEHHE